MSDHAVIFCDLAITAAEAPARAAAITKWLLDRDVIAPNPSRHLVQPSEYLPGPRVFEVAPRYTHGLANSGVDVLCERMVHHPGGNFEPPRCPGCDEPSEDSLALIELWLASEEPALACEACGQKHLLGDWKGMFNCYVAELAARFNNWPPLEPAFVGELQRRLGYRVRVIHQHI